MMQRIFNFIKIRENFSHECNTFTITSETRQKIEIEIDFLRKIRKKES